MTPARLRLLVLEHADMLSRSNAMARSAERLDRAGEVERAEITADEAAELRERADALAELLEPHGVLIPDPRQLSLLSDGGIR